jgi:hypothetical protein
VLDLREQSVARRWRGCGSDLRLSTGLIRGLLNARRARFWDRRRSMWRIAHRRRVCRSRARGDRC